MESKRALPDVFLNTNNPIISEVLGFNNNVTMGNMNCIYYVTLYNTIPVRTYACPTQNLLTILPY
jgi:hypothetical protein